MFKKNKILTRKKSNVSNKKTINFVKNISIYLAIIITVIAIRIFAIDWFTISGTSMQPTLEDNDIVLVNKINKDYSRGDVIIFKAIINDKAAEEDANYVKRIIGLPGDTVTKKENGDILVNGKKINQSYLINNEKDNIDGDFEKTYGSDINNLQTWDLKKLSNNEDWNDFSKNTSVVPEGCYFVLGDHRSVSKDSRYFGYVKKSSISGLVKALPFIDKDKSDYIDNN